VKLDSGFPVASNLSLWAALLNESGRPVMIENCMPCRKSCTSRVQLIPLSLTHTHRRLLLWCVYCCAPRPEEQATRVLRDRGWMIPMQEDAPASVIQQATAPSELLPHYLLSARLVWSAMPRTTFVRRYASHASLFRNTAMLMWAHVIPRTYLWQQFLEDDRRPGAWLGDYHARDEYAPHAGEKQNDTNPITLSSLD
jgi:hypothetical protein